MSSSVTSPVSHVHKESNQFLPTSSTRVKYEKLNSQLKKLRPQVKAAVMITDTDKVKSNLEQLNS